MKRLRVKSQITRAIDRVVASGIHPLLRENGFKRVGRTFHRPVNDLYHVVQVQSSRQNAFDTGKFTINLCIASPEICALWSGKKQPKNPGSHLNHILIARIGSYLPAKQDYWWSIAPDTDIARLSEEVRQALAHYGLAFFEHALLQSTSALLKGYEQGEIAAIEGIGTDQIRPDLHAVLLSRAGRTEKAQKILKALIAKNQGQTGLERYVRRIRRLGSRLGLTV